EDSVLAGGDITLIAGMDNTADGKVWAKSSITTTPAGNLVVSGENIEVEGAIDIAGTIDMAADDSIILVDTVLADDTITLTADTDGTKTGLMHAMSSITTDPAGNLVVDAEDIQVDGPVDVAGNIQMYADDNITLGDTVEADDYIELYADLADTGGKMWAKSSIKTTGLGVGPYILLVDAENIQVDGFIDTAGAILMTADDSITLGDNVTVDYVTAGGDITLIAGIDGTKTGLMHAMSSLTTTAGNIEGWAQNITVDGTITSAGSLTLNANDDITLNSSAASAGAMWLKADFPTSDGFGDVRAKSSLSSASGGLGVTGENITVDGTSDSGAWINMTAREDITLGDDATSGGNMVLTADDDTDTFGTVWAKGQLTSTSGEIKIKASDNTIDLDGDVSAFQDILLYNNTVAADGITLNAGDDVVLAGDKTLTGEGSLTVEAGDDIILGVDDVDYHWQSPEIGTAGDVSTEGDLTLDAGDDVYAHGDLTSTNGSIYISSATQQPSPTTTYAWGDITAAVDIWLDTAVSFEATEDQFVTAQTGSITADGWLHKGQSSLYVKAAEDISLADHVTAYSGGVSIIAENGKIFTPGGLDDTLNVSISGISDDEAGTGVDLPYGPGKAAIVIMSAKDLNLGVDGAALYALGAYDTTGDVVDDRQGVRFLDVPATIGGVPRNEGDAFDVAIYLASTEGDVDVSSP
ncbi:MAG: hypothetical protein ACYSW6_01855, partial [Planctomycetota bacterium]